MICFDWFFPESARTLALRGADIIAHPSNLILPHCPDAMVTRCIENRVFAVTANRIGSEQRGDKEKLMFIGKSQIASPMGEILYRASGDKEELTVVEIAVERARDKNLNSFNDLFDDRKKNFMNKRISVIIPNYNGSSTIGRCLEAAFSSEYDNFEVIVTDDYSTDNSVEIIKKFPCKFISLDKRSGASRARNAAAENSSGEVLFLLMQTACSGNILFPRSIKPFLYLKMQ